MGQNVGFTETFEFHGASVYELLALQEAMKKKNYYGYYVVDDNRIDMMYGMGTKTELHTKGDLPFLRIKYQFQRYADEPADMQNDRRNLENEKKHAYRFIADSERMVQRSFLTLYVMIAMCVVIIWKGLLFITG